MKREAGLVIMVSVGLALVYLALAASTTLWDRDEPRFARAAVEMVQTGDWLVPHFNGEYRLHKPPLVYWAMAPFVALLGPTTLAVRLPSVLAMAANAAATYLIGRRMFDHRTGVLAMVVLGTAALPIYIGSVALSDALLNLSITLAVLPFVDAVYRGFRWWQPALLALALGAALLTKGPVGLAVPLLMFIAVAAFGRAGARAGRAWWVGCVAAMLVGVGLFLAWAIPANIATGGRFYEEGIGRHVLGRSTEAMEGHGGSGVLGYLATLPLYIPFLIAGFFPWTMHLPGAVRSILGRRLAGSRERTLLVAWALPTFLLMTFVATKLPHYILPIYPALAIACAAVVEARRRGSSLGEDDRAWLRGGIWFYLPVAGLACVALGAAAAALGIGGLWLPAGLLVGLIAAASFVAVRQQLAERVAATTRCLAVAMVAAVLVAAASLLPMVDAALKPAPALAAAVHARIADDAPVYAIGYDEPSLVFYMNRPADRPIRPLDGGALVGWAEQRGPGALIVTERALDEMAATRGRPPLRVIGSFDVVNYSSGGKRLRLLAVVPE